MYKIINIEDEDMFVSLDTIVKFTENEYKSVQKLIRANKLDLETLNGFKFEEISSRSEIDWYKVRLNEDASTYLITLMANSEKVKSFKFNLVVDFKKARKEIRDRICEINQIQIDSITLENQQKETQLQIAQQNLKEAKRKIHAYPRNNGFESVTRIIEDYGINITPYDCNKMLVDVGMLSVEVIQVNQYKSLQMSGNTPMVHVDTILNILDKKGIKRGIGFSDTHPMLDNI